MTSTRRNKVVALSGGVGGAKLALGLAQILEAEDLAVVVNTGDDFRHLGLSISPDIDTLLYTLSHLADPDKGWGRRDETWTFMRTLAELGEDAWFQLGDADLALHIVRSRRLDAGDSLSEVTAALCRKLAVRPAVLPMTDARVETRVRSEAGWLAFQDYFVRLRCEPAICEIEYQGAASAAPAPGVLAALADEQLRAVVICPSNPWLSVGPMLALPGMRAALKNCKAPVIAVSPLIGGQAVKGPTAKLMAELKLDVSAAEVARYYDGLADGFMVDDIDADTALPVGMQRAVEPIMMRTLDDRVRVARAVLALADQLRR